jgi:membrane-associated protease RseP (regulator of RpoE activity)
MKPHIHPLSTILLVGTIGVFSLCVTQPSLAIEPPPDNAAPPAALQNNQPKANAIDAKLPFIGLVTASLPDMVADHLNIKPGTGVIVRTVMPNSPAAQSGLKSNDIILSINETAINNPEAFSAKIHELNIGEKLKLKTIQNGKPTEVEVTLGERPAAPAIAGFFDQQPMLDGLPDEQAMRLRDLIEKNMNAFGQNGLEEMLIPDARLDGAFNMLREQMNQALQEIPEPRADREPDIQLQQKSTIRIMDNQGSIEFKSNGESSEVTVRDPDNKILYSGPWDTEQDKAAVPDELRERIDQLNIQKGKGFSLRLGK